MIRAPAVALVAALVVATTSTPAADGCRIETGPHFRVVCHFDDQRCAADALETAEAIWPLASEFYGLPAAKLDAPLDVHLYRRAEDYLARERELAAGRFDKNLAFWSFETRSCYVAVQPDLTDEALAAVGLTAQTRHLVAHEAAHLVRSRASPSFRSHPGWLADGAAIWIEEETLVARGWSAGLDEDPYVAADMIRARTLLQGGRLPGVERILRDETSDMDMYDRYAVRKLLFRRLVTRKDAPAFRAAVAKALRLEEGEDYARRFFETVTEPYATEGFDGLDLDYEQYVRSLTPAWNERFRALSTAGAAWTQTAFAENNAVSWRTAPIGADAYEVRGEIEILPGLGKSQQMNLLLANDDDGFVAVAFVAGYGVDVLRFLRHENRWEKLASGATKAVQLWRRLPFRATVGGGKVAVQIDGVDAASADVKDRVMSGPWGLGVQAGAAGIWRGVKVEPLRPR